MRGNADLLSLQGTPFILLFDQVLASVNDANVIYDKNRKKNMLI